MEKPLIQLNAYPAPTGLADRVVSELRLRERRRERNRAMTFIMISLASLAALVPAFENVKSAAAQSGFARYASLAFSDWSAVVGIWKLFAITLAETAPVFALAISAAVLLAFVWSAAQASRYVKAMRLSFN